MDTVTLKSAIEMSEIWRHKNSGGLYRIVCEGLLEADADTDMVVYRNIANHQNWVRPATEFYDGRFERLSMQQINSATI